MWWEKVIVKITGEDGKGPGKRWGHTCNTIKGGRFIYVFGGYGENNSQTNKVYVFRTLIQSWSQPEMKGHPPIPRDSHTCSTIGDNLFVFGGTDGVNPLNDLHFLDTSSHTWISPSIRGDGPAAREGHSAAVVGKRLFIFGGCGKSADNGSDVYYNDLYILNTETFVWRCATTSGTPPSPRDSHSCSSWKNKIIVVGGEDGHDYYLSDVHILDTDTLIWRKLATSGQLMPPRAGHSAVCFGKHLFVFGGFTDAQNLYNDLYMLDIDTGVWTNITTTTNSPSARFSVAGDSVDPIKSGVLVFIGGCNKSLEGLDDMFYLYTGMTRESGQRQEKLSLRKQLKLKCQEQNLNPAQNMVRYRVGTDIRPRITVLNCSQPSGLNVPASQLMPPPGKKMFAAKVTKNISEGYAIETVIDGKPLRGILFHNKPISLHPSDLTPTRKRAADEDGSITPNGAHTDTSKSPKVSEIQNRHAVHGDSSESHYHHHTEAHASISHKISADREPEAGSSSQIDVEKYETPKSSGGNSNNDGANDVVNSASEVPANDQTNVPISNTEVPSHDIKNDAPNCNTGFPKPATTESAACPSNQDELIGATMDCTASRTEERLELDIYLLIVIKILSAWGLYIPCLKVIREVHITGYRLT
ncbi:PREDICTED: tip elongation aberrant protein 1-like isoform X1 [Lupinus angustifolius]|uniref:tip elongation aberrant protein 1-like isoform X1 n=1 Tax=Lupinus angustifolius TaxID=3871 RepID=UPI00092FA574|nr:PREDICTED: tip elongation aberrant protein 1-like isoform X1 [Lupinus angustifolius]